MMKRIVSYLLLLPLMLAGSCIKDHYSVDDTVSNEGEKEVMLKIAVPTSAPQDAPTRSIGSNQENTIETLDVLAFKKVGGVERFQYWSEGKKGTGHIEGASSQAFNVKLQIHDYDQRFVVITNARAKILDLVGQADWGNADKETMLSLLEENLGSTGRWNAISNANYSSIPMWGETEYMTIQSGTATLGTIYMLRMVAKIEVEVHSNVTSVFKLKSVHLYNTNTSGRIVPKSANIVNMKAVAPSLPASVLLDQTPLAYSGSDYFTAPSVLDIAMKGSIYLFERSALNTPNSFLDETCIVVGGQYNGGAVSYYRIDFLDANNKHIDILRNHAYLCNIVEVKGPGYPTVDEAYRTKSFNMVANVLFWDDSQILEIVFDGQNYLGVSGNPIELSNDAHDDLHVCSTILIATDVSTGWKATIYEDELGTVPAPVDGSFWLGLLPASSSGPSGANPDIVDLITTENTSAIPRTAYIHIQAGRLRYVVTLIQSTAPGLVTVRPEEFLLPNTIPMLENFEMNVECKRSDGSPDPNANWTLTVVDDSWCRLATDPNVPFGSAEKHIFGTGSTLLYLIAENNGSLQPRQTVAKLHTSAYTYDAVNITQWGKHNEGLVGDNEGAGTPVSSQTYVGAFWRGNEKGERIIHIEAGAHVGAWTATVKWADARWGNNDGVVLSTDMVSNASLSSRGISFTSTMDPDLYGSAEDYALTEYNTTIYGDVVNNYITFRIGLRSTYVPTANYPARYAVVLLAYADSTLYQKIYIRQGEGADYLMTKGDAINSGGMNSSIRPSAVMFTPYNLTKSGNLDEAALQRNGTFTDYPTQAGAFFQWAHTGMSGDRRRYAWNPYTLSTPTGWNTNGGGLGFWSILADEQEVCPIGYHRPNDGSISGDESCISVSGSEMRQSLFSSPGNSYNYTSNVTNSIWGYYADGFFDRRRIVNGTTVMANNRNVAYVGRIFFNPLGSSERYNASLFFPAAGFRYNTVAGVTPGGDLHAAGLEGNYWSASINRENTNRYGLGVLLRETTAGTWRTYETAALSVRCVKD
ncbi:MAG: DUF4906 domain-containing protein [Bacteroidetes bacterium]|nr:DUF4906 domain-containing protein [Bacteroidota bacterium]